MRSILAAWTIFGSLISGVNAQPVSSFKALQCNFTFGHSLRLESDGVKSASDSFSTPITIAAINLESRTAQLIGNAGTSDLAVVRGESIVSFVEVIPNGGMMVVGVHGIASNGHFVGTLTRSINIRGVPMTSSYFGVCAGLQ